MKILKLRLNLTEDEIINKLKSSKTADELKKWQCIHLVQSLKGITTYEISKILCISVPEVYLYVETYNKYGAERIKPKKKGVMKRFYLNLDEEREILRNAENYLWDLFKRHKWSKKKPRPKHPNSNKKTRGILKKLKNDLDAIRLMINDNRPVRLFFQDEGRFGIINNIQKCWVPKGEFPVVKKQVVREFIYAYSSICPETGECFSLILPASNTQMMNIYFSEFSIHYKRYRIIMCLDKAGWHTCHNLNIPENIILWFLPAYSPELNPIELLWRQIRQDYFNNKLFKSLENVKKNWKKH